MTEQQAERLLRILSDIEQKLDDISTRIIILANKVH